ncbi:NAD(P)H-dependent glycerol-3-phosphate dehydrogenase [Neofamilia massiliensis]|uniref:NAD(P)H-dependent glycerol-3-phosphate dehydrogenase n=1 Tax=Neofamilia massiliensis TaxID=1673724 RepID=UPI0006BB9819|nr:NAD(P)H-dependent glycerol-3-phosphate dehydrogenase [Neofamilia massiliensis]
MRVGVIGGGSWGTALARELANKNIDTKIYIRNKDQYETMKEYHINKRYLADVILPESLKLTNDLDECILDKDFLILAVPTSSVRSLMENLSGKISKDVILVNVAKGIEVKTLKRISEIVSEFFPENKFVALSGPTHAEEVAIDFPSTIVAASENLEAAEKTQNLFMSDTLRVYTNDDLLGVELAGALKNIIALANGILVGLGYGDNSRAALMTRGLAEITRLGKAMGAQEATFLGLTGVGDLIVTCTSEHSRNRTCGKYIGQGMKVEEAIEKVGMVVEGIKTTASTVELAKKYKVDMPIATALYEVIYEGADVKDIVTRLMSRSKKHEIDGYFRG